MPPLTTAGDWRTFSTATIQPVRGGRTRLIARRRTRRCWRGGASSPAFTARSRRQDHAGAHPPCQCAEVEGSQRHRTCVCASEGSAQSDNPHDRSCPSPREDRARQPCLQHAALHLAADKIRACLRAQAPRIRLRDNTFHQRLHRNANFKLHHLRANKNRGYWRCGHWACLEPNCLELPKETRPPDRATPSNTCLRNKEANNAAL